MAEPKAPTSVSKALNTAWVRPFLFLIFIVVAWDLAIRVFKIPAYQIPAPADVVAVQAGMRDARLSDRWHEVPPLRA